MVHPRDHGLAVGRQASQHQARGAPQVGGHHGRAVESGHTPHDDRGTNAVEHGPHAFELRGVVEPLGINLLGDHAVAVGQGQHRQELGLEIGGEAGPRLGCHFNRFLAPVRGDAHGAAQQVFPVVKEFKPNPNPLQHIFHAQQGILRIVAQFHPATSNRGGDGIGARNDAVGHHAVGATMQTFDAIDHQPRRTFAGDLCAHRAKQTNQF